MTHVNALSNFLPYLIAQRNRVWCACNCTSCLSRQYGGSRTLLALSIRLPWAGKQTLSNSTVGLEHTNARIKVKRGGQYSVRLLRMLIAHVHRLTCRHHGVVCPPLMCKLLWIQASDRIRGASVDKRLARFQEMLIYLKTLM